MSFAEFKSTSLGTCALENFQSLPPNCKALCILAYFTCIGSHAPRLNHHLGVKCNNVILTYRPAVQLCQFQLKIFIFLCSLCFINTQSLIVYQFICNSPSNLCQYHQVSPLSPRASRDMIPWYCNCLLISTVQSWTKGMNRGVNFNCDKMIV